MRKAESVTAGVTESGLTYLVVGLEEHGAGAKILVLTEEETRRVIASLEMALTGAMFTPVEMFV